MIHERKKRKRKSIQTAGAIARKQASKPELTFSDKLINEIREMIETSRARVAQTVNVGMTLLYRKIGCRIHQDILREKRAEYGAEIVASLSRQLVAEYGSGFSEKTQKGDSCCQDAIEKTGLGRLNQVFQNILVKGTDRNP